MCVDCIGCFVQKKVLHVSQHFELKRKFLVLNYFSGNRNIAQLSSGTLSVFPVFIPVL